MCYRPGKKVEDLEHTLLSYCRQIGFGMDYLSRKAFVYRDLAARNILVAGDETCKVSLIPRPSCLMQSHAQALMPQAVSCPGCHASGSLMPRSQLRYFGRDAVDKNSLYTTSTGEIYKCGYKRCNIGARWLILEWPET